MALINQQFFHLKKALETIVVYPSVTLIEDALRSIGLNVVKRRKGLRDKKVAFGSGIFVTLSIRSLTLLKTGLSP
jgi:hypothetical protein